MLHWQKTTYAMAVVLLILIAASPGASQTVRNEDLIMAHLEFLGYTCDVVEQGIRARHSSKIALLVGHTRGGILLQTGFPGKHNSSDENVRYALLNAVNMQTRIARVFWTQEGHLFVSAWMPGAYEKSRFAAFMEAWEQDLQILRDFSIDLKPHLAE